MSTIDLTQDAAPAPAPIDLTQDEAPKRKAAPAPAEPPKKRRGSKKQTRGDLESRVMSWNGPNVEPLVSPQKKLENAYTSYEEKSARSSRGRSPASRSRGGTGATLNLSGSYMNRAANSCPSRASPSRRCQAP